MNKSKKTLFDELISQVLACSNRSQLEDFLTGILTPGELEQIAKRLQIVKRLKKGEPQRNIADDLEVGIATVTRGSRELADGRFGYIN